MRKNLIPPTPSYFLPFLLTFVVITSIFLVLPSSQKKDILLPPTSSPILDTDTTPSPSVNLSPSPFNSPTTTNKALPTLSLSSIKYTLPGTWQVDKKVTDSLFLAPPSGGYLNITIRSYSPETGRRTSFCQLYPICTPDTYFTPEKVGNLGGYRVSALDNSGGGDVYIAAKGNQLFVINTYSPPPPNEFHDTYQSVLDSLLF